MEQVPVMMRSTFALQNSVQNKLYLKIKINKNMKSIWYATFSFPHIHYHSFQFQEDIHNHSHILDRHQPPSTVITRSSVKIPWLS